MRRYPFALLVFSFSIAAISASGPSTMQAAAQASAPDGANDVFTIKTSVRLVEIPVLVRTPGGEMTADNLQQSNFEVYEDNVAQDILLFKHEDTPVKIGIVLNIGNIPGRNERVEDAASTFIHASNPGNKTFILNFDGASYYKQPQFHRGIADLVEAFVEIRGDAVPNTGTEHRIKKAVLLITDVDGGNSGLLNNGIASLLRFIQDSNDIMVYAVGLLAENGKPASKTVREGFVQIAERTGGASYFPKSVNELPEICRQIAHELRNQYTLGYSPKNTKNDGSWRAIRVSVVSPALGPKVVVRARQGYAAPSE